MANGLATSQTTIYGTHKELLFCRVYASETKVWAYSGSFHDFVDLDPIIEVHVSGGGGAVYVPLLTNSTCIYLS